MAIKNIVINTTITMMIMMGLITTVIADLDHPANCTGKKVSDDYTKKVKTLVQKLQYGAANDPTLRAAGTEYSVTGQASCRYRKEGCSNCLAWGVVKLNGCHGTRYGSYFGSTLSGGTCQMSYSPVAKKMRSQDSSRPDPNV